jgi:hypothetical protein
MECPGEMPYDVTVWQSRICRQRENGWKGRTEETGILSESEALSALLYRASLDGILVGAALEIIALPRDNFYPADGLPSARQPLAVSPFFLHRPLKLTITGFADPPKGCCQ